MLFKVRTSWSTIVGVDANTRQVVHASLTSPLESLFAYLPPEHPSICFLIPETWTSSSADISGLFWTGSLKGFSITHLGKGGVRFEDPRNQMMLSATPPGEGGCGELALTRDPMGEHIRFELSSNAAPAGVLAAVEALAPTLAGRTVAEGIVRTLAERSPPHSVLQAVGGLLTDDEVSAIAPEMVRSGTVVANLATLQEDLWASRAFPDLARWLDGRGRDVGSVVVDPSFDPLAASSSEHYPATFAAACVKAVRNATIPRRRLCTLATARNEGPQSPFGIQGWVVRRRRLPPMATRIMACETSMRSS